MASKLRAKTGGNAVSHKSVRGAVTRGGALRKEFEETLHPRGPKGQFARKFGVGESKGGQDSTQMTLEMAKNLFGKMSPEARHAYLKGAVKHLRDSCG